MISVSKPLSLKGKAYISFLQLSKIQWFKTFTCRNVNKKMLELSKSPVKTLRLFASINMHNHLVLKSLSNDRQPPKFSLGLLNIWSWRKRGSASNPKMEYQVLSCIFHQSLAMATLGLKEMGKFLWEGREKGGKSRKKGRARIKK